MTKKGTIICYIFYISFVDFIRLKLGRIKEMERQLIIIIGMLAISIEHFSMFIFHSKQYINVQKLRVKSTFLNSWLCHLSFPLSIFNIFMWGLPLFKYASRGVGGGGGGQHVRTRGQGISFEFG